MLIIMKAIMLRLDFFLYNWRTLNKKSMRDFSGTHYFIRLARVKAQYFFLPVPICNLTNMSKVLASTNEDIDGG